MRPLFSRLAHYVNALPLAPGWVGGIALLGMAFLAAAYYKERTLYIDPAMQLWMMLNADDFIVFANRYSMLVNQTLPWLVMKMGLGVKPMMFTYSLSFVVIYALSYGASLRWLRAPAAALVVAAIPFGVRHAYVHSISETMLAFAYGALWFAWLVKYGKVEKLLSGASARFFGGAVVILMLNYYIHPGTLFILAFGLGYYMLDTKAWLRPHLWMLGVGALGLYLSNFLFPGSGHEEGFFAELKNWREILPQFFSLNSVKYVIERIPRLYWVFVLLGTVLVAWWVYRRQWLRLVCWAGFVGAWGLVTIITFHKGDSDLAMESRYLPFIFFVILPLAHEMLAYAPARKPFLLGFLVLLGFSLWGIRSTIKQNYSVRLHYMDHLLAATAPAPKVVLTRSQIYPDRLLAPWAISVETALRTAMSGPEATRSLYLMEDPSGLEPRTFTDSTVFLLADYWLYHNAAEFSPLFGNLRTAPYVKWETPIP